MITIIVPTVTGREDYYERCVNAYENNTEDESEIITIKDRPTCGLAWQDGVELADRDTHYIHFTADDLEPCIGWDHHARAVADAGNLPAPLIFTQDTGFEEKLGITPDGFFSRIPFCTREQWEEIGPMIPLHYFTDNWFSWRGRQVGYEIVLAEGYAFKHHWAMAVRGAGMPPHERMSFDAAEYEHYKTNGYEGPYNRG